ncbi:MAG: hypothetical protein V2G42_08815 [bacterium JZ-2024 1]
MAPLFADAKIAGFPLPFIRPQYVTDLPAWERELAGVWQSGEVVPFIY